MTSPLGTFSPLDAPCERCEAQPGQRCMMVSDYARKPHAARVRLARALAAHADPALDAFFKMRNQCGICGVPGMPQRHRRVDGIAGMLAAGEDPGVVAVEHYATAEAVAAVQAWMDRWPGAWR